MGSSPSTGKAMHLQDEIGRGAFGVVYKAKCPSTSKHYAVKMLIDIPEKRYKEVLQEVAAVQTLGNHPNVVEYIRFNFIQGNVAIVFELCEGNLNDYIIRRSPDNLKCATFCKQMTDGLLHIHDHKLIHRDIKPDNILIKDGVCKISDLGVSKAMEDCLGLEDYGKKLAEFYTYSAAGTPVFWAPEVIQAVNEDFHCPTRHITRRCDIFSLGLVFLVMFTKEVEVRDNGKKMLLPMIRGRAYGRCRQEHITKRVRDAGAPSNVTEGLIQMLQLDYEQRGTAKDIAKFMSGSTCTVL